MNGQRSCKQLLADEWNEAAAADEQLPARKLPAALAALGLKIGVMTASQARPPAAHCIMQCCLRRLWGSRAPCTGYCALWS